MRERVGPLLCACVLGLSLGKPALAQDAPPATESPAPPAAAPEPAPAPAPAPAPEPAPKPAEPPAAPPPAAPPPPTAPSAAPAPPPKKDLSPAAVTLEETAEPAPSPKKAKKHKKKKPPAAAAPPAAPSPAAKGPAPVSAKPSHAAPPAEAGEEEGEEEEQPKDAGKGEEKKDEDDGDGLLGPFRIGVIVGTGLPSVVSFGGMIKLTRFLGAGLNIGLIPAVQLSLYGDAKLSYQEYDIYGRLFPFGGSLFVGAGVGYATMTGSFKAKANTASIQKTIPQVPNPFAIDSEGSVRTLVLTPTIGLLHTFKSGFTLGFDVGVQMPIAPSKTHFETQLAATPGLTPQQRQQLIDTYVTPNDKKVQDTLDTIGRTIVPTLNLRIGWLL